MLPSELLRSIFVRAAHADQRTARSLAYVSKLACNCTKEARWRSISLTSIEALVCLLQFLYAVQTAGETQSTVSVPSGNPAQYTRILLVNTETPSTDLLTTLAELPADVRQRMVSEHEFLAYFPNLDALSLGSAETQAFSACLDKVSPVSLRLVYNGNESLLRTIFPPYPSANAARGAYTVPQTWRERVPVLRRRLRYLHITGVDPQSELTGLPMPIDVLEPLCVGSTSPGSFLHAYLVLNANKQIDLSQDALDLDWTPGVTYLRYDTRKFSYRPTDIMASRLRPFFQQLSVEGEDVLLEKMGASRLLQLDIRWIGSGPVLNESEESQRVKLNSSMFSGGWPRELRGAWTDRGQTHRTSYESFRYELYESISSLYGWEAPSLTPAHVLFTEGAYVDRIESGFSAKDRQVLDSAQAFFSDVRMVRDAQEALASVQFRVRYPASFLHLGEAPAPSV
ncbi:hypothetical protein MBRA1_002300 [Malassezia brasiliensis]|uniref:Uncharacterized protein n=1 Tax=Malassezia brasiliensis TaxID=1821822 RepID=A0AAF0DUG1_9BASI|nr:hypothetical protein MBRA1_002300 [Malassezia brasiliensis]